jgi:hypothetical protein
MIDASIARQIFLESQEKMAQHVSQENQWPIEKAREFVQEHLRKRWEAHVKVYEFLAHGRSRCA